MLAAHEARSFTSVCLIGLKSVGSRASGGGGSAAGGRKGGPGETDRQTGRQASSEAERRSPAPLSPVACGGQTRAGLALGGFAPAPPSSGRAVRRSFASSLVQSK